MPLDGAKNPSKPVLGVCIQCGGHSAGRQRLAHAGVGWHGHVDEFTQRDAQRLAAAPPPRPSLTGLQALLGKSDVPVQTRRVGHGVAVEHLVDGLTEQEFFDAVWNRRDESIWQQGLTGEWALRDSIVHHVLDSGVDAARLNKIEDCNYLITPSAEPNSQDNKYLLMGRGYIDKYDYGALEDQPPGSMTPRTWQRKKIY